MKKAPIEGEELELALEIRDHQLAGDLERLLEIEIDEFSLFVIGIEDLILDRLNAYTHWKSISDYEQALKIFLIHHDQIYHDYLVRQATSNAVLEGLKRLGDDYLRFLGS